MKPESTADLERAYAGYQESRSKFYKMFMDATDLIEKSRLKDSTVAAMMDSLNVAITSGVLDYSSVARNAERVAIKVGSASIGERKPRRVRLARAFTILDFMAREARRIVEKPPSTVWEFPEHPPPSRRVRHALDLTVRMLPPKERQRYRMEFLAELADLPGRDQAPHAFRLLIHGWSLRRSLNEQPSRAPTVGLAVMVVVPGADALAAVCGLNWQAAVLGVGWTAGLMWVVSSKERTRNLVTLIRETRTSKATTQK